MTDPALDVLLHQREILEAVLSKIDVWLLVFGIFVVIGVGGESVFGIRAWWNSRKLHSVQMAIESFRQEETAKFISQAAEADRDAGLARKETELLKLELAKTTERAANADKSAAESKLALEKLKQPRRLTPEQQTEIASKVRSFGGINFDTALTIGPESQSLLLQVEETLKSAGWTQVDWSSGPTNIVFTRNGRPKAGVWTGSGVVIELHKEKQELYPAVKTLVDALVNEGVKTEAMFISPDTNSNPSAIHVMIGEKPK